ncbi:MAG: ComF family protein [Clostridiales bacterium]|nr:ComF family protein [Clostridiales bacterium]
MTFFEKCLKKLRKASGKHGYTCDSCGAELFDYPTIRLCEECEARIERNDGKVCEKCGRKTVADGVCSTCKDNLPTFTYGVSPFVYRAETAALVNRIKNGNRRLAFYFGEQMTAAFLRRFPIESLAAEEILIVPVPLSKEKRRERGYNQAEEIAEALFDCLRAQGVNASLDADVLYKKRDAEQQKHLGVTKRRENAVGAYHLHKRKLCQGKTVLLVDDILTTGATGSACAKPIATAGAKTVILLTVASLPERK